MKLIFGLIAFLLLPLVSIGQVVTDKVDIKWGQEVQAKRMGLNDIVGRDETGIYCRMYKKRKTLLVHFDRKMNMTKQVELDLEYMSKKRSLQFITQFNGELYMFTSFFNQKLDQTFLFKEKIDKKTLIPSGKLEKVVEVVQTKRFRSPGFTYNISEDKKHFLLSYTLPYEKDAKEKLGFVSFDDNMNQVWTKEVELPYVDQLFGISAYRTDNQGNAYIIGRKYEEKRTAKELRREGKMSFQYLILSYRSNGEKVDEYKIDNGDKFITDLSMRVSDNDELVCAGLYSDKGSWSVKGSFFLRINAKTKQAEASSFKAFGFDFITQDLTERKKEKAKKRQAKGKGGPELYQYDLDNLILRADGGAVLVAEQFFITTYTTTSRDANGNTTTRTHYVYHYNDIIVININPEGVIEWQTKIPKRQSSTDDGGYRSSYMMGIVNDKIYFIFNDNIRNITESDSKGVWSCTFGRDAMVALVEMDADGVYTRQALMLRDEDRIITVPKLCEQIGDNEIIVYGSGRKKFRFASVKVK